MAELPEAFAAPIERLRKDLRRDGADLVVTEATPAVLRAKLVIDPEACLDCIVPGDMIRLGMERALQRIFPGLSVHLYDPRSEKSG